MNYESRRTKLSFDGKKLSFVRIITIFTLCIINFTFIEVGDIYANHGQSYFVSGFKCCVYPGGSCSGNTQYTFELCTKGGGSFDPECVNPTCGSISERGVHLIDFFGSKLGFSTVQPQEPEVIAGKVAQGLLVVIGAIFGVLIIYAGVRWMTARGNEETVKQAIETLQAAVIGFVVVVGAYAITAYVVGKVISAALTP